MKVKVNLTNQTLECLDNKPYIQGYDTRNKLIVYVDASVTLTNIQIAYQLQNGRNTIKLPNNGIVEATLEDETTPNPDYIEGYNGFIFNAFTNAGEPLAVTNQAGNFTATLVFKVGGNTYKLNVLNTVLKSTDFEEFENAVEGVAQEVLHSLESMSDTVAELQQTVDDIAANDFSEDEAKEIFYTKTQSDSKYAKFKLITNVANIPVETLESLEIGDILVSGAYAYMVLKGLQAQNAAYNRFIYGIEDTSTLKVYWYEKTSVSGTDWYLRILTYPLARYSSTDKLNADYIADGTTNKVFTGTEKTKLSGIETGAEVNVIEGVKVNGTAQTPDANKIISLTIPTQASDVNALSNSTKYCASCALEINSSTYVMSLQLKDQDGNNLGTAKTIDLPLETMVVSGSYDSATKKVVLTLQNEQTIEFSVADLVSGLQTEITAQNKLSSDLVDDTGHTHKFATAEQLAQIETNKNALSGKVDKVTGKGLSTNDYTNEDKAVVEGLNSVATTTTTTANTVEVPTSAKGLATLKRIGGMSYVYNQLVSDVINSTTDSGITFTKNEDKSITISGTATAEISQKILISNSINMIANHKYLCLIYTTLPTEITVGITGYALNNTTDFLWSAPSNWAYGGISIHIDNGTVISGNIKITPRIVDLTKWFGSNDNIPSDLLSNPSLFRTKYYLGDLDYNTGSIHDSAVTKVESVGVNIWDEEWEAGYYTANGEKGGNSGIRSTNYISVLPNKTYYAKCITQLYVNFFTSDKANINQQEISIGGGTFITPSNCVYITICTQNTYGTTYNHDICINVSNSAINGNYYPYVKYELPIPQAIRSITGYGWGVNENCYNYIDFTLNEFRQYVARVDLGSLNWTKLGNYNYIYKTSDLASVIAKPSSNNVVANVLSNTYSAIASSPLNDTTLYCIAVENNGDIFVNTGTNTTPSGYLYYELATPVITDISSLLDEVHIPIEANGTLELVNTYNNAVPVIVSFDNGLADMVKTNHEHDIEQQKEIEKLEQYNASKKSILDNIGYLDLSSITISTDSNNPTALTDAQLAEINKKYCIIKYFNNTDFYKCNANYGENIITFSKVQNDFIKYVVPNTTTISRYKLFYYALIVDTSAKTIYLNTEDKADFYSKNKVDDLLDTKADKSELTYYIHNIRLECNNSTVDALSFKLIRRTDTQLTLADLKSEEVSYLKAFDVMAKIKNGNANYFYSSVDSMSFNDSSDTTWAFSVSINYQQNDKTLSEDGIDVAVAEVTNVSDIVVDL